MDSYDAIVVGSGASGGWAARELTASGLRTLVLEAGPDHEADAGGPPVAPDPARQPVQSRSYAYGPETAHLFVDDVEHPYWHPEGRSFDWIRGRQVGGRMHVWAGMSPRLSDHDLHAANRDGFGEDWPLDEADLAPYYDRVERFLGVEPPPLSAGELLLQRAVVDRWPTRRVTGPPIATAAPSAALVEAARTRRMTLRPNAFVTKVLVGHDSHRARGVAYVDGADGGEREAVGRVVFLCASTIESTRLLLNSATRHHPRGLANSSGVVGRYLADHTFGVGIDGRAPLPVGSDTGAAATHGAAIPAFRNVTEHDVDFLRGYGVRVLVDGSGRFWMRAFGEVLSRFDNRIELDASRPDRWGVPTVRIDCAYGENERLMAADQVACLSEMAEAAGFEIETVHPDAAPPGSSAHELGTARMGRDPRSSVLNSFNQAWDVENLFVTDGASFTSAGHQNPTLTMMALTSRACDYAIARLRRREL